MNFLAAIGSISIERLKRLRYSAAMAVAVLIQAVRPHTWKRTVRNVLARQILYTGADAAAFTSIVALLVGISVVVQAQLWLGKVGQTQLLGPILVAVIIRELGPLLANLIVIGRSGTAMAAELAIMKVTGEVRALDAQGVDPFLYLVVPRAVAMSICAFCLTVLFIAVCLFSGYTFGVLMGARTGGPGRFVTSVADAIGPADVLNVAIKSIVPGLLSAVICCGEGLSVGAAVTEIPPACTRAVQRSVATVFILSAAVSLISYL